MLKEDGPDALPRVRTDRAFSQGRFLAWEVMSQPPVWRRFSRQVRSSTTLIEVWDQDAPSTFARGELVQTFASDGDFYAALTRQGWEPLPGTAGFRTRGRVRLRRFVSCCVRPTTPT